MAPTIWTVGYEKLLPPALVAELEAAGVRRVIDVRFRPQSRRPGMSKTRLGALLAEHGIAYEHRRELGPGAFGENLTVAGVDVTGAVIGERWRLGTVELEVCQPRFPCFKLGLRFGDPQMLKRFTAAGRPGAYLRIVREGEISAGDAIEVADRPAHGITTALVARAVMIDHALLEHAASAPALPGNLASWMRERAA